MGEDCAELFQNKPNKNNNKNPQSTNHNNKKPNQTKKTRANYSGKTAYTEAIKNDITFLRRLHVLTGERQVNHLSYRNSNQVCLAREADCWRGSHQRMEGLIGDICATSQQQFPCSGLAIYPMEDSCGRLVRSH